MDEHEPTVTAQTTITPPFLDDEVPALYLADGRPYIPVFSVCHALGIQPDIHIRRWRRLLLWVTARKLPFQTAKQGKRLVWCLLISEVPFLYSLFNWELVSPERCLQLCQATKEQVNLADLAYQQMQAEYKAMRRALFSFLTNCADIDTLLTRYTEVLGPWLDGGSSTAFADLCKLGRSLFDQATIHARKMLQEQGELPVVDAIKIDANDQVIDTFSMPLLPVIPREGRERFFELMKLLTAWRQKIAAFWNERDLWPDIGN